MSNLFSGGQIVIYNETAEFLKTSATIVFFLMLAIANGGLLYLYWQTDFSILDFIYHEQKLIDRLTKNRYGNFPQLLRRYAKRHGLNGLAKAARKIQRPELVTRLFFEVPNPPAQELAHTLLSNLVHPAAIEEMCTLALTEERALQICLEAGYTPSQQFKRGAFFLLTEQWAKYREFDPDNELLPSILAQNMRATRQRILTNIQRAGMTALLEKINSQPDQNVIRQTTAKTLGRPDRPDWESIVLLRDAGKWSELWELLQKTSAFNARLMLAMFIKAGQTVNAPTEKPLFERLCELAQKCDAASFASPLLTGYKLQTHQLYPAVNAVVKFSPDGQLLAVATTENVQIWQTWEGRMVGNFLVKSPEFRAAFLKFYIPAIALDDEAAFWPSSLEFSSDSKQLAAIYNSSWFDQYGYGVALFDLEAAQELRPLLTKTPQRFPRKVLFSPDNQRLLIVGNTWLQIYQLADYTQVYKITFYAEVTDVAFLPNGETLAVGFRGGNLKFYAYPSFNSDAYISPPVERQYKNITISPNGELLACGPELAVWNTQTGQQLANFAANNPFAECLDFSPNGQALAVGSPLPLVRLWSSDGSLLQNLKDFKSPVVALKYSPDGQQLLTLEENFRLTIWASRLLYLYNLPVSQATLADLKWLKESAAQPDIPDGERAWFEFIAAQLELKWRYEIEIEAVNEVTPDRFDIELDAEPSS